MIQIQTGGSFEWPRNWSFIFELGTIRLDFQPQEHWVPHIKTTFHGLKKNNLKEWVIRTRGNSLLFPESERELSSLDKHKQPHQSALFAKNTVVELRMCGTSRDLHFGIVRYKRELSQ